MKKTKFEIKDILTNKKKLDRRYYLTQRLKQFLAAFVLGAIMGALFGCYISSGGSITIGSVVSPNPLQSTIEVRAVGNTKPEIPYCYDPIICIRDIGEELGMSNKDITTMVRIAKCESNFKPNAKNPTSTATGIFQIIIGTWDSNKCDGERWDFVDNIKCGWKIYQLRGTQPWVSSKGCWNN